MMQMIEAKSGYMWMWDVLDVKIVFVDKYISSGNIKSYSILDDIGLPSNTDIKNIYDC